MMGELIKLNKLDDRNEVNTCWWYYFELCELPLSVWYWIGGHVTVINVKVIVGECYWCRGHYWWVLFMSRSSHECNWSRGHGELVYWCRSYYRRVLLMMWSFPADIWTVGVSYKSILILWWINLIIIIDNLILVVDKRDTWDWWTWLW